ncbi:MAG: hypothetical protein H6828_10550 [Planctomycetes bacterium]|nr:hypothetical protein [Planctomycetota bacterium]
MAASSRPAALLLLVVLPLAGAVAWWLWSAPGGAAPGPAALEPGAGRAPLAPLAAAPDAPSSPAREAGLGPTQARGEAADPDALLVLAAESGAPLEGAGLYRLSAPLGELSDAEGRLVHPPGLRGSLIVWAPGRLPLQLNAAVLPQEVRLERGDAAIELHVLGLGARDALVRSELVRLGVALPHGPWSPTLNPGTGDVWTAEGLAPGRYELHYWIRHGRAAANAYSVRDLELAPGERRRLQHDADQPPPRAEDQ